MDSLSDTDMDIDDKGPSNEVASGLLQADVRMKPELDPEEVDEEVPEGEEGDLEEDEDVNIYNDNDLKMRVLMMTWLCFSLAACVNIPFLNLTCIGISHEEAQKVGDDIPPQ